MVDVRKLLWIVAAVLLLASCGGSQGASGTPQAPDSVKVGLPVQNENNMEYYVAQEKGYFKQAGVNVTFDYGPPATQVKSLAAGDLKFANEATIALVGALKGLPVKQIFASHETSTWQLWGKPGITSVADLKGKKVATEGPGTLSSVLIRVLLQKYGLRPSDINEVSVGPVANWFPTLKGGTVDAAIVPNPSVTLLAKRSGLGRITDFGKEIPIFLSGTVVSDQLIKGNQGLVRRFVGALYKGLQTYRTDRQFAVQVIQKVDKVNADDAQAIYDADVRDRTTSGKVSDQRLAQTLEVLSQVAGVPAPSSPSKFADWSFLPSQ